MVLRPEDTWSAAAERLLEIARTCPIQLQALADGAQLVREGVFGDAQQDAELKADIELGKWIMRMAAAQSMFGRVSVEGFEDTDYAQEELWLCADPLDGSLNYRMRCGSNGLPFTTCLTLVARKSEVRFSDIVAGVVVDLRSSDCWLSRRIALPLMETTFFRGDRIHDRTRYPLHNGEKRRTLAATRLDLGTQIVIGEMYYPENREKLLRAFAGEKGWLRNPGSAAYEMALVANGTAASYICDRQKQHELGAGYALVTGAGGVGLDFEGQDLGVRPFLFHNAQTPVILAANASIAEQVLERLHRI